MPYVIKHFRLCLKLCFAAFCIHFADAAAAPIKAESVAPSTVTPRTFRPPPGPASGIIIPSLDRLEAPAGADKLSVTLQKVVIEGAFEELAQAGLDLARLIEGKRLTVLQLYQAVQAYEASYGEAGYILARVTLPPQTLVDGGTLRVVVVDGFIEDIDAEGVAEHVRAVVVARTISLVGRRHITLSEIERRLLIAGDVPGLRLRSTLTRGEKPGGAKLVLEGEYRLVTGALGGDNRLNKSLGTWEITSTLALNSALGLGELVYGAVNTGKDLDKAFTARAPLTVWAIGLVVPLGTDGWTLAGEYTKSRTRGQVFLTDVPDTIGWFSRLAIRTSYPLIRRRTTSLVVQAAVEYIDQLNHLVEFNIDLSHDHYRVFRGGAEWVDVSPWGQPIRVTGVFSRGLGGRVPGDSLTDVPLSRLGASPIFSKVSGDVRVQQPLPGGFVLPLILRAQSSFGKPMMRSEQFALDAIDGLSSFAAGTSPADEGITGRAELARPFDWQDGRKSSIVAPYLFYSTGKGYLRMPTIVEPSSFRASAVGIGLRTNFDGDEFTGVTVNVEYGKQYSDYPGLIVGYRTMANILIRF